MKRSTNFDETRRELLTDPELAAMYLEESLEAGDMQAFALALRHVAQARGGFTNVAEKTKLSREQLYRTLSKKGNPKLDTLSKVLHSVGLRLSVVPEALG